MILVIFNNLNDSVILKLLAEQKGWLQKFKSNFMKKPFNSKELEQTENHWIQ